MVTQQSSYQVVYLLKNPVVIIFPFRCLPVAKLNYNQDSLSAIILKVIGYKSYHNLVAQILRNLLGNRFAKNVNFK